MNPHGFGAASSSGSVRKYRITCHRCSSGSPDHDGIPYRSVPFSSIHINSPSVAPRTRSVRRLGLRPRPDAVAPWHEAHRSPYTFAPASTALPASGFTRARACSGTCPLHSCTAAPPPPPATIPANTTPTAPLTAPPETDSKSAELRPTP